MTTIKKDNVTMTVDDKKVSYYLDRGYQVCSAGLDAGKTIGAAPADLSSMTVVELRKVAKSRGVDGADALRKSELLELLEG